MEASKENTMDSNKHMVRSAIHRRLESQNKEMEEKEVYKGPHDQ